MLIVDDDAAFRRVASALLDGLGFRVVSEARDGEQEIAAAAQLRPVAVVLDVRLRDADGVLPRCRLTRAVGPPRVLLTSTDAAAGSDPPLEASGAMGFVPKHHLVATALRRLLGSARKAAVSSMVVSRLQPLSGLRWCTTERVTAASVTLDHAARATRVAAKTEPKRRLLMSPRLLYLLTTLRAPHAFDLYCDWIDAQRGAARMSMGRRLRPAAVPPRTNV